MLGSRTWIRGHISTSFPPTTVLIVGSFPFTMPSLHERSDCNFVTRNLLEVQLEKYTVKHVIQSDTLLTTMVTTFPVLSERHASLVGYGNFMHIGNESLSSSRHSGDENNSRGIFRRRSEERLAEFRYNVNGNRLWKRRASPRPKYSNKRELNRARSLRVPR